MSFSSQVKEELAGRIGNSRHCQLAQLAGLFAFAGRIVSRDGDTILRLQTENPGVMRSGASLIEAAFGAEAITFAGEDPEKKGKVYVVECGRREDVIRIMKALKLMDEEFCIHRGEGLVDNRLIQQVCCRRAFIRGAFLAAGSISDPERFYHFEIVCHRREEAVQMMDVLNFFDLDAKLVERKKYHVAYVKEGDKIVDVLNVMEAYVALMHLENIRIVKEMRNNVNRQVNCETANINKTVSAAVKQKEDIEYIREHAGLEALPESLREIAVLRLENASASLKELGEMLSEPVGKSGVNHRLRKISIMAEELREKKGGARND